MIEQLRPQLPVARLCAWLDVAKRGYQQRRAGGHVSDRQHDEARRVIAIKAAHPRGRGIYGPKKIRSGLGEQGMSVGLNCIGRLRRLHDIRCMHSAESSMGEQARQVVLEYILVFYNRIRRHAKISCLKPRLARPRIRTSPT